MSSSRREGGRVCGRCGGSVWTRDRERLDPADGVVTAFETCAGCGAVYLLNLGPPRSGLLPFSGPQPRTENEKGGPSNPTTIGLLVVALAAGGCHPSLARALTPPPKVCADGGPIKVLQDPGCEHGYCGWSCEPTRWRGRSGG
jgi:hypothetical protein